MHEKALFFTLVYIVTGMVNVTLAPIIPVKGLRNPWHVTKRSSDHGIIIAVGDYYAKFQPHDLQLCQIFSQILSQMYQQLVFPSQNLTRIPNI